jgi:guanylate kinase
MVPDKQTRWKFKLHRSFGWSEYRKVTLLIVTFMVQGKLIVMTGPSGVGKGTLVQMLLKKHPQIFLSVSATTRQPRAGEVPGESYYFVDRPQFETMVAQNELLEWAEFTGNCYGTPRGPVEARINAGEWVVLEIELEGARQVRQTFPEAYRLFILPPSIDELESRIRGRGTESEEAIIARLDRAQAEIDSANEFDVQIINDQLDLAFERLEKALFAPAKPESAVAAVV